MIDEYLTSYQLCRGILCVPFIFILCLAALGEQEIQTTKMINFQFCSCAVQCSFQKSNVKLPDWRRHIQRNTFQGYLLSPTLLLPKRPLSKCSFYRLITLAGTMHCGDTQTSAEVFIFNIVAPTPSDTDTSASVCFIPIFGKENFYYKTVQRLPIF